jgi:hypothetical protein
MVFFIFHIVLVKAQRNVTKAMAQRSVAVGVLDVYKENAFFHFKLSCSKKNFNHPME